MIGGFNSFEPSGIIVIYAEGRFLMVKDAQSDIIGLSKVRRLAAILRVVVHHVRHHFDYDARHLCHRQVLVLEALLPHHDVARLQRLVILHERTVHLPQRGCGGRPARLCRVAFGVVRRIVVGAVAGVAENAVFADETSVFESSEPFDAAIGTHSPYVTNVVIWTCIFHFN